jgi:hypothetical protein
MLKVLFKKLLKDKKRVREIERQGFRIRLFIHPAHSQFRPSLSFLHNKNGPAIHDFKSGNITYYILGKRLNKSQWKNKVALEQK